MSHNLYCKEVQLLQTPTHITDMCLFADIDKDIYSPWQTVAEKYLSWIRNYHGNELQNWDFVRKHELEFKTAIKKHGKLHFSRD